MPRTGFSSSSASAMPRHISATTAIATNASVTPTEVQTCGWTSISRNASSPIHRAVVHGVPMPQS